VAVAWRQKSTCGGGRRRTGADDPAEEYESENDATVSVEEFGRSAMKDRLQTNLLSGSGAPAVSMLESVDGPSFIDTGSVAPLTDEIEEAGIREDFVSGKWEALTVDGDIYARSVGTPDGRQSTTGGRCTTNTTSTQTASRRGRTSSKRDRNCRTSSTCSTSPRGDLSGVWRYQFRQLSGEPFLESGEVNIHNEKSLRVARNIKEIYDADIAANIEGWTAAWFSAYGDATIASLPSAAWMEGTLRAELPDTAGDWGVFQDPRVRVGRTAGVELGRLQPRDRRSRSDEEKARGWDYMEYSLATEEMQLAMYDEYGLFLAGDRLRRAGVRRGARLLRRTGCAGALCRGRTGVAGIPVHCGHPRGVTGHRDRTAANDQR